MTDKLLPCPFCGGKAEWFYIDHNGIAIGCMDAFADTHHCLVQPYFHRYRKSKDESLKQAISDWNQRPEEKTGKWIYKPDDYAEGVYECSECGEPYYLDDEPLKHNYHFCPNCGARMEK